MWIDEFGNMGISFDRPEYKEVEPENVPAVIFITREQANQEIKQAKLDLIGEILAMQFEGSAIVSVDDILEIKEKLLWT